MGNMYFIHGQNIYIRPGAEVLGTFVLGYWSNFFNLTQIIMDHVLVLILNVLRFYECVTSTSEFFLFVVNKMNLSLSI